MIVSKPMLAMINERRQLIAKKVLYEILGKRLWKSWAKATTRPIAVVMQVIVVKAAMQPQQYPNNDEKFVLKLYHRLNLT